MNVLDYKRSPAALYTATMTLNSEGLIACERGGCINVPLVDAFSMALDPARPPLERVILAWTLCEHLSSTGYHSLCRSIDAEFARTFLNVAAQGGGNENVNPSSRAVIMSLLTQIDHEHGLT